MQDKIHQGERQLRDSEQRYRALFDLAPDAVLVHADGVIRLANPFAARLLGAASPESLVGKALASLILPGQPGEQTLQRLDGASVAADLTTSAIAFGDQTATMVIARDISARKTIEQTLVRQDEELKRSNAELEQFAYVASHDLREPLRMVSSYVALLERRFADKLDADGRDFIAFAKDGAQRMDRLILDLLEYSRIGRRSQPSSQVPLAQAVAEALANLEVAVADAGASVTVAKDLPAVMGDSDELMRLFQNLIGNALKYRSPDRPAVVGVTCRRDGDDWLLAVTDNGIGIDADSLERVFGIFQRLHARSQFEGTGIGLAICRKIVERHGGRIWVQSVPGQGSEFLFRLPVA